MTPWTAISRGLRMSLSVVIMSPTRSPISSEVVIGRPRALPRFRHAPLELPADRLTRLRRGGSAAVTDPTVGGELPAETLDRVERNAEVHHPANIPECQLEADQDHDFIGRDNLNQLGVAFHAFDAERQCQNIVPGTLELREKQGRDARCRAAARFP